MEITCFRGLNHREEQWIQITSWHFTSISTHNFKKNKFLIEIYYIIMFTIQIRLC